ncbi:MAG TPA: 6-pyruvoyl-tetrahydropterin synthase-related protein [Patescibacteria group bacterium]|nr:6-pyruvoyl-tetrahydropterin synthase-related protein [Patescibacteria group bacterium]
MNKLLKRNSIIILLLIILFIPTFYQMLRFGMFSTQDFHIFRLIEFDKCIQSLQIPCRWAPDSGAGFGEPLFNFYGQFVYVAGEIIHKLTFSFIDSIKITFILSLVLSGIGMFFLAKKIWGNNLSALVSSIIYLYAPYRAVDVWVRGALPEAFAFVFFPLIILEIENYLEKNRTKDLLIFSLLFSFLIITHNLSVILFAPFLIVWIIFRFLQIRKIKPFIYLFIAGIFSGILSAFYLLPVATESKFINLNATTTGIYDWRANFVTIYQLFISRFWGYGGSTWGPNDGLSLSVGQIQWIVPAITGVIILIKQKTKFTKDNLVFTVLVLIGIFALFMTHNKSTFIWNILPFMKYIQFPWRFLSTATFSFALASGLIIKQFEIVRLQFLSVIIVVVVTILLNFSFFKPDIWYSKGDSYYLTGSFWNEEQFSSLPDYWPNFGHKFPDKISDGKYINYFPGWNYKPDKNGLISSEGAVFGNTSTRTIGNYTSLFAILVWIILFVKFKYVSKDS